MRVQLDFDTVVGKIKPLHGIDNAPVRGLSTDLMHYLKDAGIPYSRLNDMGGAYGGGKYVDIANLFRNFSADPSLPESYDFAFTDWLFEQITAQGTEIFFRLGPSIENSQRIKAYYIYPPEDDLKWAQICEGIIKHYNYGWANGYHYNIQYWEIWNEPDNEPEIADNPCWKGTKERFFQLYETAANYLKAKFPELKIGGYASCGFYSLTNAYVGSAQSSVRTDYFIEFFQDFLAYISSPEHKAPLDFFSWHSYAASEHNRVWADYVRENLDKYGFQKTESILNEWNPDIKRRGTPEDACYVLDMLLTLHSAPVDLMAYYDGEMKNLLYCGLFDMVTNDILPAYYALHAFNELYRLKNEVKTEAEIPVLAATDGKVGKLLVANPSKEPLPLSFALSDGWTAKKLRLLDGKNGLVELPYADWTVPPMQIAIVEFVSGAAK